MTFLNFNEMKEELVMFLRNQDVISTSVRGVTTVSSKTFNGDGTTTDFLINRPNVKNVRSVEVGGTALTYGTEYNVNTNYDDGGTIKTMIEFTNAPASGTDNIDVSYDYGTGDKIYPDYPRPELSISSYPRIAISLLGVDSEEAALGGETIKSNISFSVTVFDDNETNVDTIIGLVRNKFLNNKKSFYNFRFITPIGLSPMLLSPERGDKITSRTIDFLSPLNIEE